MHRRPGTFEATRKNALWFVTVVTAALLQTTWPESLKLQEVLPDLTLLLVVYFAIADGEERAMATGLLGGIYQDVASNAVLGHHVLCLVIVGYLIGRVSTRLITEHPAVKAGLAFLAGIVNGLLYAAVHFVQDPDHSFLRPVMTSAIPSAFYTALVSPVVFLVLMWMFHRREAAQGGLI